MYLFVNSFSPLKLYVLNILTTIRQLCLKPCMAVRNMLHCINSTRNGTHDALNILSFFLRPEERKTICHCVKCFLRAQREHFRAIPLIIGRYTWNAELLSAWHGAIYMLKNWHIHALRTQLWQPRDWKSASHLFKHVDVKNITPFQTRLFLVRVTYIPYNLYSNPLWDIRPNSWLNSINDDAIPCSNHVVKSKQLPLQKNQKTTIDLKKVLTINYNNGEKGSHCKNNKMIETILLIKIEKLQI